MINEMMASMCYIGFIQRESGFLDKAKSTYEELLEIAWHENSVVFERVAYQLLAFSCSDDLKKADFFM